MRAHNRGRCREAAAIHDRPFTKLYLADKPGKSRSFILLKGGAT
jgi:hypothetical protein